jgi:hypothetical protein
MSQRNGTCRNPSTPQMSRANLVLRARQFARRGRDEFAFAVAVARLLLAARLGRLTELWIGDSHVAHHNDDEWPCPPLRAMANGRFVWHIGPRLMYSLARDGFPPRAVFVARLLGRIARAGHGPLVLVAGEIDIRCHLAPRLAGSTAGLGFPATYVVRGQALARLARSSGAIFVVPVPPSDDFGDAPGFPIKGTLGERIKAFEQLRQELLAAVALAPDPAVEVVDCTSELADSDGAMRSELTVDGCHVNAAGRQVVQARVAEASRRLARSANESIGGLAR